MIRLNINYFINFYRNLNIGSISMAAKDRAFWNSRIGFVCAASGSAVGLANLVRFPYLVGESGGGAFLLIYLVCLFLLGLPVFLSEIFIGSFTNLSPYGAFRKLGNSKTWGNIGFMTILTGFLVSAFYSVMAGQILGYFIASVKGDLAHITTIEQAQPLYTSFIQSPSWTSGFHFLFLAICGSILYFGIANGIERVSRVLVPLLFLLLVGLCLKGVLLGSSGIAIEYLFYPDWGQLSRYDVLTAMGQAFFTLSIGQGTMVTYGSYLKRKEPLLGSSLMIIFLDTCVSILASVAVFTVVFEAKVSPNGGLGLIFHTIPVILNSLPLGAVWGVFFFILTLLAAITSQISAMEPMIAYLQDHRHYNRTRATMLVSLGAALIGLPIALSWSYFSHISLYEMNIFETVSFICSDILIPLGGFLAIVLVAWKVDKNRILAFFQLPEGSASRSFMSLYIGLFFKFLTPFLIILVCSHSFGLI